MKASLVGAVCLVLTTLANPGVKTAQERACGSSDPVKVINALDQVVAAMKNASPRGWDYYPLGKEADFAAKAAWFERRAMIDGLRKKIEAHVNAIVEQGT
jgi:hypothetical protein